MGLLLVVHTYVRSRAMGDVGEGVLTLCVPTHRRCDLPERGPSGYQWRVEWEAVAAGMSELVRTNLLLVLVGKRRSNVHVGSGVHLRLLLRSVRTMRSHLWVQLLWRSLVWRHILAVLICGLWLVLLISQLLNVLADMFADVFPQVGQDNLSGLLVSVQIFAGYCFVHDHFLNFQRFYVHIITGEEIDGHGFDLILARTICLHRWVVLENWLAVPVQKILLAMDRPGYRCLWLNVRHSVSLMRITRRWSVLRADSWIVNGLTFVRSLRKCLVFLP